MGQTSNPTLRYPDGTDRPRATQIRNLAEDVHAELAAKLNPLHDLWSEVVPWTNLTMSANFNPISGFTPQFCVVGPLVYVRGMVSHASGTFFGANMCWLPSAYGPGATLLPFTTTKVQNEDNVLQLMVSAAGAISCTAATYATGSTPGAGRAINVSGSWVRKGMF